MFQPRRMKIQLKLPYIFLFSNFLVLCLSHTENSVHFSANNSSADSLIASSAAFNKSNSQFQGKCYFEVPTGSLVPPKTPIPPGNSSNINFSIIETCCQGYQRNVHNLNICEPICKKPCVNGLCVRPNVCQCFPDHVRSLNGDCIPTCPIGCLNGQCDTNGTCTCKQGYVLEPGARFCVPHCSGGCEEFFNCTAPELCTCRKGYKLNTANGKCEPRCIAPCGNGVCSKTGICTCFPGYNLVNNSCQANCTKTCENGRCIANEICGCDPGWILNVNGTKCSPYNLEVVVNSIPAPESNLAYINGQQNFNPIYSDQGDISQKQNVPFNRTFIKNIILNGTEALLRRTESKLSEKASLLVNAPAKAKNSSQSASLVLNNGSIYERQPAHNPYFKSNVLEQAPPNSKVHPPNVKSSYNDTTISVPGKMITTSISPRLNTFVSSLPETVTNGYSKDKFTPRTSTGRRNSNSTRRFRVEENTTQVPVVLHCQRRCINGYCSGINHCSCNHGFIMAPGRWYKCIPYCPLGCSNGTCTSPGFCVCNSGFRKRNNRCVRV